MAVQPANAPNKPAYCEPPEPDALQTIANTPGSPYFVHHPAIYSPTVPTIIFLSGGSGTQRGSQRAWNNYLSHGSGVEAFRIILPYAVDEGFLGQHGRTFDILEEVLACYGGNPARVHIGGYSNGGYAAFELMLWRPQLFATLLGAPGAFPRGTEPAAWAKALAGKAIFNGVGENDVGWKSAVEATHDALVALGIDSVYVEFPGQGHVVNEAFDESILVDFWLKHSR